MEQPYNENFNINKISLKDPFLSKTLKKTWGKRAKEISQKADCAMINLLKKRELGKFIKNEMPDLV